MITDIITNAPLWVWLLLAYLIFVGIKSSKPMILPLGLIKRLMIIPLVFMIWALYTIFESTETYEFIVLMLGMILGTVLGYFLTRHQNVRFDRKNQLIAIPGSWMTLIVALSIFCLKFSLGALSSIQPELKGTWILLLIQFGAVLFSGIFVGRGINYRCKYRSSAQSSCC